MTKYGFREGTRLSKSVDPQKVGPVLARFEKKGELTSTNIVEEARQESSPLHDAFTWDDQEAAEERRLEQSRYLIAACVVITLENNTNSDRVEHKAFHHVPPKDQSHGAAGSYAARATLLSSAAKFDRTLDSAQHRMRGAQLAVRELLNLLPDATKPATKKQLTTVRDHLDKAARGLEHIGV